MTAVLIATSAKTNIMIWLLISAFGVYHPQVLAGASNSEHEVLNHLFVFVVPFF